MPYVCDLRLNQTIAFTAISITSFEMFSTKFHWLIAALNSISVITNSCSFCFVANIFNIKEIVHYRILAMESALVTMFSFLSLVLNIVLLMDVSPFSKNFECAFLSATTGIPLYVGVVSSALTALFRFVFLLQIKSIVILLIYSL